MLRLFDWIECLIVDLIFNILKLRLLLEGAGIIAASLQSTASSVTEVHPPHSPKVA